MKAKSTDSWFVKKLIAMGACREAIRYTRKCRTFPAAWNGCERWDWLVWLVRSMKLAPDHFLGDQTSYCLGCQFEAKYATEAKLRRRFPATRVSAALRKVKA